VALNWGGKPPQKGEEPSCGEVLGKIHARGQPREKFEAEKKKEVQNWNTAFCRNRKKEKKRRCGVFRFS